MSCFFASADFSKAEKKIKNKKQVSKGNSDITITFMKH
jgi:hypothetical protein